MKRLIVIALLALPMGAFCSLAKPASAAVPFSPALSQGTVVAQRYDDHYDADRRDHRQDDRRDDHQDDRREYRQDDHQDDRREYRRDDRSEYRRDDRRDEHRVWIPRHWQSGFLGIGGHWVEGHWEDR